jgi:hypothetical protein
MRSRATLYNRKKKYKDKGIEINGDRSPRRKRKSQ